MLGFIECFFMPGRVREFNAIQAAGIAAALGIAMPTYAPPVNVTMNVPPAGPASAPVYPSAPPYTPVNTAMQPDTLIACSKCQKANPVGAKFCSGCGNAL